MRIALPELGIRLCFYILLWYLVMMLCACGSSNTIKVKGGTTHTVEGEAHVVNEIVLKIDVSACESLDGANQAQCITDSVKAIGDLVQIIKSLTCKDQECMGLSNDQ